MILDGTENIKRMLALAEQETDRIVQAGMFRVIAHMASHQVTLLTAICADYMRGDDSTGILTREDGQKSPKDQAS